MLAHMEITLEGLVLESKYPEFLLMIKGPLQQIWRDGFPVQEQQVLQIQFDRFLCELDDMARAQEWGEEQKAAVKRALEDRLRDPMLRDVWIHETPRPPLPWPTYEETPHGQVPTIAQATGMVEQALAYEERGRAEGPRKMVVVKLEALRGAASAEEPEPELEPVAAGGSVDPFEAE
jgi:hypothetical protein